MNASPRQCTTWLLGGILLALATPHLHAQSLHWANGDSLPGTVHAFKDGELTWKSPLLDGDLLLDARQLARIHFGKPTRQHKPATGTLQLETRQGDQIHGKLTAMDKDTLTLTSPRYGTVRLQRKELLGLHLLAGSRSYTLRGLQGWTAPDKYIKLERWRPTPQLGIATQLENSQIFHPITASEPCLIELALNWKRAPAFVFALQHKEGEAFSFKLETWDRTLVLLAGKHFKRVLDFQDPQKHLGLRIFYKPAQRHVSICDHHGKLLAEIQTEEPHPTKDIGFLLKNKGADLTLAGLHAMKWNGNRPRPTAQASKTRLLLRDGTERHETVAAFDPATQTLILDAATQEETPATIRLADIARIQFASTPANPGDTGRIAYADGMFLRGDILSIQDRQLTLRVEAATHPMKLALEGCRSLHWPTSATDIPETDNRLNWDSGHSHGTLAASSADGFPLAWTPIGAKSPTPLRKSTRVQIKRLTPAPIQEATDILNLTDRTAHPVNVQRISEGQVHFTATFLPAPATLPPPP